MLGLEMLKRAESSPGLCQGGWRHPFGSLCWLFAGLGHCPGHFYLQAMLPQALWPPGPACQLHLAPADTGASPLVLVQLLHQHRPCAAGPLALCPEHENGI